MRFQNYVNEAKMGKLPGKVKRIAHGGEPFSLEWILVNPDNDDERGNLLFVDNLAHKELMDMKRKGVLDFYDSDFTVNISASLGGQKDYMAEVKLKSYDDKKLRAALRKYKFKVLR